MKKLLLIAASICSAACALGQDGSTPKVVQADLTRLGGTPFYLQASITERDDPSEHVDVEMSWVSPGKWKRKIQSQEFSQTLIVNGDKIFEQDSSDYMPLPIRVLTTAMVSPQTVIDAFRPGDFARTKVNGLADESGRVCFSANSEMCGMSRTGLTESVAAAGRSIDFTDYRRFKDERVARLLTFHYDRGDSWQARVNVLGELQKYDEAVFHVENPTPKTRQIQAVVVPQAELRDAAQQPLEIIWPQVLDGNTSGETSYYVSVDRSGQVREVLPVSVAVERADDSARRQIMKWRFRPALSDGAPVQVESLLKFAFNTREFGPANPLTDEEARKLASNVVDPVYPEGTAPSGSTFSIRIAVDEEGYVIESIAGDGPRTMSKLCSDALKKWRFSPILDDGKPRPYRAEIKCRIP